MLVWINGKAGDQLAVSDRGLAYGDGLFETIKVLGAKPLRLQRHLARLANGCQRLWLTVDLALVEAELLAFAAQLGEGVMKLIITRGEGLRGYVLPEPAQYMRIIQGSALPYYDLAHAHAGIKLFACQTRLARQPLLAGLKHLNRLEQVMARHEWQDTHYAEGLLLDAELEVIEGVFSNLFMVKDAALFTPALTHCGVAGVMRAEIIAYAQKMQIPCTEASITLEQFLAADEVFFCNSLYGIWPVTQYQARTWPVGPVTRKLQSLISTPLD